MHKFIFKSILIQILTVLPLMPTAHAAFPCNADGLVSENTPIYTFARGNFVETDRRWLINYYARIVRVEVGNAVDGGGNILEEGVKFDLVSFSDNGNCNKGLAWVRDADYYRFAREEKKSQ